MMEISTLENICIELYKFLTYFSLNSENYLELYVFYVFFIFKYFLKYDSEKH